MSCRFLPDPEGPPPPPQECLGNRLRQAWPASREFSLCYASPAKCLAVRRCRRDPPNRRALLFASRSIRQCPFAPDPRDHLTARGKTSRLRPCPAPRPVRPTAERLRSCRHRPCCLLRSRDPNAARPPVRRRKPPRRNPSPETALRRSTYRQSLPPTRHTHP